MFLLYKRFYFKNLNNVDSVIIAIPAINDNSSNRASVSVLRVLSRHSSKTRSCNSLISHSILSRILYILLYKMASIAMMVGGALVNALAFTGSNFVFGQLSKDQD